MSNIFSTPEKSIRRYATYQLALSLLVFTVVTTRLEDYPLAYYGTLLLGIFTLLGWLPLAMFACGPQRQRDTIYSLGTVSVMNIALISFVTIDLYIDKTGLFMAIKAFLFIANILSISVLFSYCFSRPSDYIRNAIVWFNVTLIMLMVLSLMQ